jgi:hypothetical protein
MGLQMNYNTEVQMLTESKSGMFTLTTKDGRVILLLSIHEIPETIQNHSLPLRHTHCPCDTPITPATHPLPLRHTHACTIRIVRQ